MVAFCFPSFCIDKDFEGKQKAKLELASASKNFPSFLFFLILKENLNNVKAILFLIDEYVNHSAIKID